MKSPRKSNSGARGLTPFGTASECWAFSSGQYTANPSIANLMRYKERPAVMSFSRWVMRTQLSASAVIVQCHL
jgi:hypothetical protein